MAQQACINAFDTLADQLTAPLLYLVDGRTVSAFTFNGL
jgi:hypothetical protein